MKDEKTKINPAYFREFDTNNLTIDCLRANIAKLNANIDYCQQVYGLCMQAA